MFVKAEVGGDDAVSPDEGDKSGRRQEGPEGEGELKVLFPELWEAVGEPAELCEAVGELAELCEAVG